MSSKYFVIYARKIGNAMKQVACKICSFNKLSRCPDIRIYQLIKNNFNLIYFLLEEQEMQKMFFFGSNLIRLILLTNHKLQILNSLQQQIIYIVKLMLESFKN